MGEAWKAVPGYEGKYIVSNCGRIYSLRTKTFLKGRRIPTGYVRVNLPNKDLNKRDSYIHRIVAEVFCDHPEGCDYVNHIDFNPANNNASNLEWTSQRTNVLHSMNHGRVPNFPNAVPVVGIKDGKTKLYPSAHDAAESTGCDSSSIIKCCKKKHNQTHGYIWKYAEVI